MKIIYSSIACFYLLLSVCLGQETLQSVTDRGNTTVNGIYADGESTIHGVSFKTVDLYYKELRPEGFNLNIKNGAGDGKIFIPYNHSSGNIWFQNYGLNLDKNMGIRASNPQTGIQMGELGADIASKQILIPGVYNFEQLRLGQIGNGNMAMEFVNHIGLNSSYGIRMLVDVDKGAAGFQLQHAIETDDYSKLNYSTGFYMSRYGDIGIGTTAPQEKLSVNGKIRAKEIKVETANWPDYVFEDNYQLPDLKETEDFIKTNKHLPGIPSAKEVEEHGVSLGEMNAKLLKKVEELTLYLIEKDRQYNQQKQQLEKQAAELMDIKQMLLLNKK